MAGKKRRLSQASIMRYYAKRFTMNVGTTAHVLGKEVAGHPMVAKAIEQLSYQETYNWITDYQASHLAKQVTKQIAEKYNVPPTFQGLLMAYAEKVVANYILDYKGEPLTQMHDNYLRELMQKMPIGAPGTSSGYVYVFIGKDGKSHTVDMSKVLTDIENALLKRA
ncbi:virion structural protein [Betalipothrixvirus pezzuloense]|uniref:Structural protein n=1 Tax=Betalipothrixvirus pezzuloense TaxID=346883 RepID=A7WKP6_9VIRU|nr:virion structural protein [Acidianus filamentous virus 7]CAJ31648.1 structural protein [Acidianus filamentous virus 7]